jgi:hypothetical protein
MARSHEHVVILLIPYRVIESPVRIFPLVFLFLKQSSMFREFLYHPSQDMGRWQGI